MLGIDTSVARYQDCLDGKYLAQALPLLLPCQSQMSVQKAYGGSIPSLL